MNKKKGSFGEATAVRYLTYKGLKVLAQNYVSRYGEIDVVALAKGCLVFIEVKLRSSRSSTPGRVAVGRSKQKRMVKTALTYISENKADANIRFDVVEIEEPGPNFDKSPEIFHLENAFSPDGLYLEAA